MHALILGSGEDHKQCFSGRRLTLKARHACFTRRGPRSRLLLVNGHRLFSSSHFAEKERFLDSRNQQRTGSLERVRTGFVPIRTLLFPELGLSSLVSGSAMPD